MDGGFPETADIETASEDYARRFAGPVGAWFLERQARSTLELLSPLGRGARVLDVGGGHAQLTPALVDHGYEVTVVGSAPACAERLSALLASGRCRFELGNVIDLPYGDRSFDAVLSLRLLPHVVAWRTLLAELCRVARRSVVVDYPSSRSINVLAGGLFPAKKRFEGNTRPFVQYRPAEIEAALGVSGFQVTASRAQFLWPMVLHRMIGRVAVSKALEAPGRAIGLLTVLGSPVIVRAERVN
jgi:2-polyprenyl-3-methyl-5-hydroxy-6-metoxy-1,4-benzoquinol methylase